jgi:hypothetical protein
MVDFNIAYRADIIPCSGGWDDQLSSIRHKVSALTRNYRNMWIGICSQEEIGLRQRWNSKYKGLGMTRIAAVYRTESDSFRKKVEKDLVAFYEAQLDNENDGGGGPKGLRVCSMEGLNYYHFASYKIKLIFFFFLTTSILSVRATFESFVERG